MANIIHANAVVSSKAVLGDNNIIGPNVVIESGAVIGSGNKIGPGAIIFESARMGDNNQIHAGAIIGDIPQDISYDGAESFCRIGNNNRIREYVTIHRGTKAGSETVIGDDTFLMGYTHVAHNCKVGNGVITVNTAVLGGYVEVDEKAFVSASVVIHQFCRIGKYAMLSGLSAVTQDVPPYVFCGGRVVTAAGINVVGLRRGNFSPEIRKEIKTAYKVLYRSGLNIPNALIEIEKQCSSDEVKHLLDFIRASKRGIISGGSTDMVRF